MFVVIEPNLGRIPVEVFSFYYVLLSNKSVKVAAHTDGTMKWLHNKIVFYIRPLLCLFYLPGN